MEMLGLTDRRARRHATEFDVHGNPRHRADMAGIDTGLFDELSHRGIDQCAVGGLEMPAGLQQQPIGTVLDQQNLTTANQQRTHGHMHRKTTALRERDVDPVATCEPTRTPLGNLLRTGTDTYTGMAMACLIAGDRHHHLATEIAPALRAGAIVICDRYIPSSLVLQGMDGISAETIWALHAGARVPDLAVLLSADPEVLTERLTRRGTHSRYERGPDTSRIETELYDRAAVDLRGRNWPVMNVDTTATSCGSIAAMLADHISTLRQRRTA